MPGGVFAPTTIGIGASVLSGAMLIGALLFTVRPAGRSATRVCTAMGCFMSGHRRFALIVSVALSPWTTLVLSSVPDRSQAAWPARTATGNERATRAMAGVGCCG